MLRHRDDFPTGCSAVQLQDTGGPRGGGEGNGQQKWIDWLGAGRSCWIRDLWKGALSEVGRLRAAGAQTCREGIPSLWV